MEYKMTIDKAIVDEYNALYFKKNPRRRKVPIEKPWHPSINEWCILSRIQMNALKQRWKEFGIWLIQKLGYSELMIDRCDVEYTIFFDSRRRHDVDNYTPKFLHDGFTEAGFWVDDDDKHLFSLTLKSGYDKENPRTEIVIKTGG